MLTSMQEKLGCYVRGTRSFCFISMLLDFFFEHVHSVPPLEVVEKIRPRVPWLHQWVALMPIQGARPVGLVFIDHFVVI